MVIGRAGLSWPWLAGLARKRQHLLAVVRRGEAEGLPKTVVEVALIEEAYRQRHFADRQAAAEQALALSGLLGIQLADD